MRIITIKGSSGYKAEVYYASRPETRPDVSPAFFLFFAAAALVLAFAAALLLRPAPAAAQVNFPSGEVYFSPETAMEDKFIGFLHRATGSIFIAAGSLGSKKVAEAIIDIRMKKLLPIKILLYKPSAADNPYIEKFLYYNIDVVLAENPAGFDHNFCIVDLRSVWLSSAAFEYRALNQDYNYAMIISDNEKFAENFQREFVEMFEGRYHGLASPVNTPNANINFNGVAVDTAFLPEDAIDGRIVSVISKARSKIRVMADEMKNSLMLDNIIGRKSAVKDISALFEYGPSAASKDEYEKLRRAGIYAVYNRGFTRLAVNAVTVDGRYVMLFGPNKSKNNSSEADSSFITVDSTTVAAAFDTFFDSVMQKNTFDITLTGQVVNASNSLPLDNTRVWFQNLNASAYTDHLGWYELKGELPDEFLVTAEREYYYSKDIIFLKKNGRRLDFLLDHIISYNSLSGFVTDKSSKSPIGGCGLVAVYIEQGTGTRTYIRTNTNEKGFFTFKALPLGKVNIEVSHPNYQKRVDEGYTIVGGNPMNLQSPIELETNYIITAYPNPVFEDNFLINVKDSKVTAEVPRVTIKQNNYVEVPVAMRIAASADMKNIYVGNYIIKKGYYGAARINVNGGMSWKDINIDFLQAYKKYTYSAPSRGVSLAIAENAVRRPGYLAVTEGDGREAAGRLNGGELRPVEGAAIADVSFGKSLSLAPSEEGAPGGVIELSVAAGAYKSAVDAASGGRPHIYRYDAGLGRWKMLETAVYESASPGSREVCLKAAFAEGGKYAVLCDSVPPRIEKVAARPGGLIVTLADEGSGLNDRSLSIFSAKRAVAGAVIAAPAGSPSVTDERREFMVVGADALEGDDVSLCVSDNAGNYSMTPASKISRLAVKAGDERVEVYPNPCRAFAKFRIRNAASDMVTITLYDPSGGKLFDVCDNHQLTSDDAEVPFNLGSLDAYGAKSSKTANAVLIYRVKFASGAEKTGKLAVIK